MGRLLLRNSLHYAYVFDLDVTGGDGVVVAIIMMDIAIAEAFDDVVVVIG